MTDAKVIGPRTGGGVQLRRPSSLTWTKERQAEFLAELAATCNVAASARAVGISEKTVYKKRALDPAFREAWNAAQDQGYARLEMTMLRRAANGTFKTEWHGGKKVGRSREYPDRLGFQLLSLHHASVMARRQAKATAGDAATARERIEAKLKEMNERLGGGDYTNDRSG